MDYFEESFFGVYASKILFNVLELLAIFYDSPNIYSEL